MNFDSSVLQIPIEDIIPNRFQPRRSFDDEGLQELADSIRQHGIIQPLVLRPNGDKYEIVAGERRYKASMMAGLASVPAVIARISDRQSAETSIVENVQRKPLTAIEEAQSYKALLDQGYMSQEELAKRMGLSQGAISNKLRLLTLSEEVQNAVLENKISERHARSLLKIKDKGEQNKWLNRIVTERLTVKQLDDLLRNEPDTQNYAQEEQSPLVQDTIDQPKYEEPVNFEDTAVSMETSETENDSLFNMDSSDSFRLPTTPNVEPEDTLDVILNPGSDDGIESLDFLPPSSSPFKADVTYLTEKVDSTIDNIKNDSHVVYNKEDNGNSVKYTIIINN
jgi:ParB family chromosome partitioning protein